MHPLFSLNTFSAHNSCFSQSGVIAEQAGLSGADCLQVLYTEVNQVSDPITSGYHPGKPLYKKSNPCSRLRPLASSVCPRY